MSASIRTPAQRLARDVAMAIYRRRNFTLAHLNQPYMMEGPITEEIAGYGDDVVLKIATAYPETLARLEAGTRPVKEWMQHMAMSVVKAEIQTVVGVSPRFGEMTGNYWIFMGGGVRNHADLPLTPFQRMLWNDDDDFVDVWGSADGRQVVVRYGHSQYDYVVGHVEHADRAGSHVREALRRLSLLQLQPA